MGWVIQSPEAETRELSEHLQDLFDRAKEILTPEQAARVKKALLEFVDVFAKTALDIGLFTALVQDWLSISNQAIYSASQNNFDVGRPSAADHS